MEKRNTSNLLLIFLIYFSWILLDEFVPYLNRIFDFRKINLWILPAIRMTLMFLVSYVYVKFYEKQSFSSGFNLRFQKIGKNILWAFVFFIITGAFFMPYQFLIIKPLTGAMKTASSVASHNVINPFAERLIEYLYIVYEGIIEVVIFIGFFLDRLARRWNWPLALIVANIGFALWHYNYWRKGWLEGSLMIIMTFFMGIIISLSYVKTKNSLSPVICHTLVDSPNSIRILLGMM